MHLIIYTLTLNIYTLTYLFVLYYIGNSKVNIIPSLRLRCELTLINIINKYGKEFIYV